MGLLDAIKSKLTGSDSSDKSTTEIESASDQDSEDRELAEFVKNKVEEIRSHANRIAHEGIWMTNIAYLLGFDSVFYDPTLKQFRPIDRSPRSVKRNRIHSNLLLPACQNRVARMVKNPPKYDVRPNSMEEDDKEAARLGIEIINMVWDDQAINRKRITLGMWKQQCGHAYMKVSWDDQLGDPIGQDEEGNANFEGKIRVDPVSAFECFADPLAKELEDCSYFIQCKARKLDYFRTHYPERGGAVQEEGAWLLSTQYEQRVNTLNTVGPASSGTVEQMKNSAIELSYYEKRSSKHPLGRHIIVANGVLLKNGKLPVGEIPFAKFDDVVVGGKYYSESLVTHARPLQDQYNRAMLKRAQWVNKLLAGKYIAAKGHGLIQEAIHNESGEVVEYDPIPGVNEPHAMSLPVIPQYAYTETETLKKEIFEIFGLSEVSRGNLPSASIPAMGMQILVEQDETRLGVETEQDEHAFARIGMLILKFADEYWITERDLKTKGKNLQYKVTKVTGEKIKKNFDVTVIRGSTIPHMKSLQRQEILNAMQQGLLGNPQDPAVRETVLGAMEYGEIGEVWQDYHLDMTQIQQTIKTIEEGSIPECNKYDNHTLHIMVKNRYRKSEKFQLLSPEQKLVLENDIQAHGLAGAVLQNPALANPPDNGPPPDQMLQQIEQQAASRGIDKNALTGQNNNMGAPPPGGPPPEPPMPPPNMGAPR